MLAVTATIAGILLVIQALSNADALGMVVWTLFTAGMANATSPVGAEGIVRLRCKDWMRARAATDSAAGPGS